MIFNRTLFILRLQRNENSSGEGNGLYKANLNNRSNEINLHMLHARLDVLGHLSNLRKEEHVSNNTKFNSNM